MHNGPRISAAGPRGIKYVGMLPPAGYGVAAERALLGLEHSGIAVTFALLTASERDRNDALESTVPELAPLLDRRVDYDTVIVHAQPDHFARIAAAEPDKRIIGMTTWETDRLPAHWASQINAVERVIVPCEWNREVFARAGVTVPIHVVPHISVATDPRPRLMAAPFGPTRPFVVNAIGVWGSRKNLAAVVSAYLMAFSARDHTELVLKTTTRDLSQRVLGRYPVRVKATIAAIRLRHRSLARIGVAADRMSGEEIAKMQSRADCYLSMSRGEGWGLGAFDAATQGCPVISPVHGGPRDYLGDRHPLAVRWCEVPVDPHGYEREIFERGQVWIEPDVRHAAQLLRSIYESPAAANSHALTHARDVCRRFAEGPVTDTLLAAIAGYSRHS